MNKQEHAKALRVAMTEAGISNADLATAMNVSRRTVGNWISRSDPTMPSEADRARLKRVPGLSEYELKGDDPVMVALRKSTLIEWRRKAVETEYERHLYEQERGEVNRR